MAGVDDIMANCPLKHEIRTSLWQNYAAKVAGGKPLSAYLTLYSPPLMDVKWFVDRNLLLFNGEKYVGVVGATYDESAYAEAMSQLQGRPDLLLPVDINDLLARPAKFPEYAKQFLDRFPFQVINLDYTNSLFSESLSEISAHLKAIDALIYHQDRAKAVKFVLLLTTRSEKQLFARQFLANLRSRLDANIKDTIGFEQGLASAYSCSDASALQSKKYGDFVALGLAKLITEELRDYGFYIKECDAVWLLRDKKKPKRWLLHLAFLIERRPPPGRLKKLVSIGKRGQDFEREILNFIKKHGDGKVITLRESIHTKELDGKHRFVIARLASINFEVPVPTSKDAAP